MSEYLTVKEAAAAFNGRVRSVKAMRRLVELRVVRHFRVGGRIMFDRAHLAADLAALEVGVDAEAVRREVQARAERRAKIHFEHPRLAQVLA